MNKKDLQDLGLEDEDVVQKIIVLHGKDIEKFKTDVESKDSEMKIFQFQIDEATKIIEGFKDKDIDIKGVQQKAEEWEKKAEQIKLDAEAELQNLKFNHTLESSLAAAKPKNVTAVKALLNMEDLKYSQETGEIVGLNDQIKKISEEHDYLFESEKPTPTIVTGSRNSGINIDSVVAAARREAGLAD